jgi:5-methylthioadenosine/S-adenosylhomocysteine deaminase
MVDEVKIIANALVLACDDDNNAGRYSLLVKDGRIADMARSPDGFVALYPQARVIDASTKLVTPGFINAHFHSESILLRDRTQGLPFIQWRQDIRLVEYSRRLVDPSSYDDVRAVYLASYFSHLKSGTTCVGEFGPPVDQKGFVHLLQSIGRTDVRSVATLQNWDQISQAMDLGSKRPRFALSLGREEEFTVYSFENLMRAARDLDVPLVAHVAEQREGPEIVRKNFQKNVVTLLRDFGVLQPGALLIHLNHVSEEEVRVIENAGTSVVVCARSTAYKQTGYPALRYLCASTVPLCIGTDWDSTDMMEEMRFLHRLPMLVSGVPTLAPLQLVRMATINGAGALGLAAEIGSVETGKRADLVFFDLTDLRLPRVKEPASASVLASLMVNHLGSRHIADVMINGEFFVTKGHLLTMAEDDIARGLSDTLDRYRQFSHPAPPPAPPAGVAEPTLQPRSKVVPFTGDLRQKPSGGFERGLVEEPSPLEDEEREPLPTVPPPPRQRREPTQTSMPELSKDVKRVFGEDDDLQASPPLD